MTSKEFIMKHLNKMDETMINDIYKVINTVINKTYKEITKIRWSGK